MNLKDVVELSTQSRNAYALFEKEEYGRVWTDEEIYTSLVSDIGDLGRLVLAKEGVESVIELPERLKHEIGECLWGIAVLAGSYGVDLEEAFRSQLEHVKNMNSQAD